MFAAFSSVAVDPPFVAVSMDNDAGEEAAPAEAAAPPPAAGPTPEQASATLKAFLDAQGVQPKNVLTCQYGALASGEGTAFLENESLAIFSTGSVTNIPELCELYGISPVPQSTVELLQAMFQKDFMDCYGDSSDQPATAISSFQGSFAFMMYDTSCGYFLCARSPDGLQPLYWGTAEDNEEIVLISTLSTGLAEFPPHCLFQSNGMGTGDLANYEKHTPTRRGVNTMPKVNSHGHLCAVKYKTQSGNDLVAMAQQASF